MLALTEQDISMQWKTFIGTSVAMALLSACTSTSSSPDHSWTELVDEDEIRRQGALDFAELQRQTPTIGGAPQAYAQCVMNELISALPAQEQHKENWQIRVFKSDEANVFSKPGGYIGVNSGLLDIAADQDQLAAAIGHAVATIVAQHAAERLSAMSVQQIAISITSQQLSAAEGGGGEDSEQIMAGMAALTQYGFLAPLLRDQVSEADIMALQLMADAGFQPQASLEVLENMAATYSYPELIMRPRIDGLEANMSDAISRYQRAQAAGRVPDCQMPAEDGSVMEPATA